MELDVTDALTGQEGAAEKVDRRVRDEERAARGWELLNKYRSAKASIDERCVSNTRWYRLRHWEEMRPNKGKKNQKIEPKSARLLYAILNKHADFMDNYPKANVLPREEADVPEARKLTAIIPAVFEQQDFEQTYSDEKYDLLIQGTGAFSVLWDASADSGLGEISIKRCDLLQLFWTPGVTNIQDASDVFYVDYADARQLMAAYPELEGQLGGSGGVYRRETEETHDDGQTVPVVDWYYKKRVAGVAGIGEDGTPILVEKDVLHFCKFCGSTVLYCSENEPGNENGYYWHGRFPFIIDVMYPIPGQVCGFGLIDIGKSEQEIIDRSDEVFFESLFDSVTPRYFVRNGCGVNEQEYADRNKRFVHFDGDLKDNAFPVETKAIAGNYITIRDEKVEEMKEVTGSRDVATGGTQSGVTAASAIAAMQETSGKPSRDLAKAGYRVHKRIVEMVIELVRQFYDIQHYFRVEGERGAVEFVTYTNAGLLPKVDPATGEPVRQPLFDIKVSCERESPYTRLSQNSLAMELYEKGLLNPMNALQAKMVVELMDFDGKDKVMQMIQQNLMLFAQSVGNNQGGGADSGESAEKLTEGGSAEPANVSEARQRAQETTAPR